MSESNLVGALRPNCIFELEELWKLAWARGTRVINQGHVPSGKCQRLGGYPFLGALLAERLLQGLFPQGKSHAAWRKCAKTQPRALIPGWGNAVGLAGVV